MSQMYAFMVEVNDLTANVVWANVPNANITEGSVTQHEAALAILATQITSLTATVTELNLLDLSGLTAGDVLSADTATTASWKAQTAEINDLSTAVTWANVPNGNITEGSVTQHEAALTILQSQVTVVSETATNLADIGHAINTGAAKVAGYYVWDSTNSAPVWAAGDTDGALWVDGVGTTAHTPV